MNRGVWIEVISKSLDLYECEMGPGLSSDAPPEMNYKNWDMGWGGVGGGGGGGVGGGGWDANILHWMEVKLCMDGGETIIMRPGCRWGRTWMDLKCTSWDLYGFEMGSACSWDIVITICMELRRNLNEGETRILEPVFRWDSTWMEMRHTSSKLDWLRVMPGWNWHAVFRTGWRWYRPR